MGKKILILGTTPQKTAPPSKKSQFFRKNFHAQLCTPFFNFGGRGIGGGGLHPHRGRGAGVWWRLFAIYLLFFRLPFFLLAIYLRFIAIFSDLPFICCFSDCGFSAYRLAIFFVVAHLPFCATIFS